MLEPPPLFLARIWKVGHSFVFPLHKRLLELLNAKAGDQLLCRLHPPYVTFRLFTAHQGVPVDNFTPDKLPEWPKKGADDERD